MSKSNVLNFIPKTPSLPKFPILLIGLVTAGLLRPKPFLLSSLVLTSPASHVQIPNR